MKLKSTQLVSHLKKHGLSALYLFTGDEPLQMMESTDSLRVFARSRGFKERVVLSVEAHFEWQSLSEQANSLSLFATKRLIELRLGNKSPGDAGAKALMAYVDRPPADTVLLITADKLDAAKQKTKWFMALEEKSVVVPILPIELAQLPQWIAQRMATHGLQADADVIQLIAERSEGHLLACAQEIEKLQLLCGNGQITMAQVLDAVVDSARFEIFDWVDTVLAGDIARSVRQLQGLRAEGQETVLIAWALNREIRSLAQMTYALQSGQPAELVFKNFRVWQQRKPIIEKAIKRHRTAAWQKFLQKTVYIDRLIKGAARGNVWDELLQLTAQVAGVSHNL